MYGRIAHTVVPVVIACLPLAAAGATKTTTFNVTAQVVSDCAISASDLSFGTVGALLSAVDATTSVAVTCTPGTSYSISLDAGTGSGSTIGDRRMGSGGNSLKYQLYRDTGHSQVWGNTVGTDTHGGTGSGVAQSSTVYGRIPSQDTPAVGNYSSIVTATVTY